MKRFGFLLALTTVIAIFYALRASAVSLMLAQALICLPLLILLLKSRIFGEQFPRALALTALTLAALSMGFVSTYRTSERKGFYVARLANDDLEAVSRSFRAKFNSSAKIKWNVEALRYADEIKNPDELASILPAEINAPLIWGDDKILNVSLPASASQSLGEIVSKQGRVISLPGLERLKLVDSVPFVSLPKFPEQEGIWFLEGLMEALTPLTLSTLDRYLTRSEPERIANDLALRNSSLIRGWSNQSHRALPLFLLGNRYLIEALSGEVLGEGMLHCASEAYRVAQRYLESGLGNQELLAAILNNKAIVFFAQTIEHNNKRYKAKRIKAFLKASSKSRKTLRVQGYEPVWSVAWENAEILRIVQKSFLRSGKKKQNKMQTRKTHLKPKKSKAERKLARQKKRLEHPRKAKSSKSHKSRGSMKSSIIS